MLVEKQTNSELLENLQCQRKQNQSDSQHFRNEINLLSSMLSNYSNALELCLDKCKVLQEQVNKATCAQEETENMCQNKVVLELLCFFIIIIRLDRLMKNLW